MEPKYMCNDCGREISSSEYDNNLSEMFCSECGGHIEEIFPEPEGQTVNQSIKIVNGARKIWLAGLLTLSMIGLGHVYSGKAIKGVYLQ